MHPDRDQSGPELRLPAALLRVWTEGGDRVLASCRSALGPMPGVHWVRDDLCAVVPVAGDPAVHDVAVGVARRLLEAATGEGETLQALVFTGRVLAAASGLDVVSSQLLDDLDRKPPELPPGTVSVTSRVGARLEAPRRLGRRQMLTGSAASRIPLHTAGPEDPSARPWRNPTLLRHPVERVRRPDVEGMLRSLEGVEALRVSGAPGGGKTRAVWEALHERGHPILRVAARPARHGGPSLALQIVYRLLGDRKKGGNGRGDREATDREIIELLMGHGVQEVTELCEPGGAPRSLGESESLRERLPGWLTSLVVDGRPAVLLCDDLEAAGEDDLAFLAELLEAVDGRRDLRLVLICRDGDRRALPAAFRDLAEVRVPPMDPEEMERFARSACRGLPLPAEMLARFADEAAGNPLAFEEGLAALAERDLVHEVHSSLLFRGERDAAYAPSDRQVCHVQSEVERLGEGLPLRLLALTGAPVPDRFLRSAGRSFGCDLPPDWIGPFLDGGLVRSSDGPWGPGVAFACSAHAAALAATVPREAARVLSRSLGESLADETRTGAWRTFRLLEGTESALDPLLAAARDRTAPRGEIAGALEAELSRRRATGIDPEAELELLWALLPLLRAEGRLPERHDELARAQALAADDPVKAPALAGLEAEIAEEEGRLREAEEILRGALVALRGRKGDAAQALLVLRLARVLVRRERYREASTLLTDVIPVLERSGGDALVASARFLLGNIALHEHRLEEALELHTRALEARRALGRGRQVGVSLSALGTATLEMGRYTEALVCYREAEELFREVGDEDQAGFALLGIGRALSRTGDFVAATGPLKRALAIREERGDKVGEAIARLAAAENHLDLGRPGPALEETRRAHFDLSFHSAGEPLADAEQLLGRIFLARRDLRRAREHLKAALDAHRRQGDAEGAAFDLSWLLLVELRADDHYEVSRLVVELEGALEAAPRAERREILQARLYRGLELLGRSEEGRGPLEEAYRALLGKTGHLPAELRHRFLHGIQEHDLLVRAATDAGLTGS